MSLKRTLAIAFICGVFSILVDAAFDGRWPHHSPGGWLVFAGGLVVIALGFHVAEAIYESRKSR